MVNNLPAVQETRVRSLGWEDPLEKGMATHSSILTQESHGQRSLAGHRPWGHKESDRTERLTAEHIDSRRGTVVWSVCSGQLRPAVTSQSRTFQNRSPRGHLRSPLAHASLCAAAAPLTGELGVPFRSRAPLLLRSDSTLLLLLCVCVCV